MRAKIAQGALLAAAFCLACGVARAQSTGTQPPSPIVVTIDAQQTAPPISKYEFGMFIEHIGSLIYRSLWSEMLDDRKFYFPINSKPDDESHRAGGFPGMQLRKWRPVGPDDVVVMDNHDPFVGDQSPRIALDPSAPHGVRQSGLALVKGKRYVGHILLRGTPGAKAEVALIWGSGANDRQTVHVGPLEAECKSFPFAFTAQAATEDAAFEITGTGSGDFHIGAVSLMPADNVQGFRPDTIALLHQVHSGFWRLPGGNFLSDWNWYDAVGD
ncbi:MAG TPA: alpha-N-arabinofuranosidase, partial [Terracidiphilus sp.]|nr:alpha-N-arabinofuranosidase [Terracidiphilus sp.]